MYTRELRASYIPETQNLKQHQGLPSNPDFKPLIPLNPGKLNKHLPSPNGIFWTLEGLIRPCKTLRR